MKCSNQLWRRIDFVCASFFAVAVVALFLSEEEDKEKKEIISLHLFVFIGFHSWWCKTRKKNGEKPSHSKSSAFYSKSISLFNETEVVFSLLHGDSVRLTYRRTFNQVVAFCFIRNLRKVHRYEKKNLNKWPEMNQKRHSILFDHCMEFSFCKLYSHTLQVNVKICWLIHFNCSI